MTAKEAWENLGVRTVQQVVGTAASDLTIKASELTTVATANVNMESIQHSVGTVASRIASVTSKVAYQAASKVPDLISPKQMLGFTEDGITVANRDTGSGRSMIVVQHAQVANDIWEPPINVFKMEENEGKSEAAELEKSLDEILEPTHKGNVAGRRRRTHQGHSGKSYHAKGTETPGPLRDDNKLSRKRWPRHGGLGDKTPSNDGFTAEPVYGNVNVDRILRADHEGSANNHYTKNTAQRLPGRDTSEVQDPKRRKHEGETRIQRQSIEESGSRFTDDGNSYDALGVSNVWKSPHKDLLSADRKKAISQRWENQQDRSARDDANRKVPSETGSRPSQIPLMAARGHRAVEDVGRKDMTQQGKIWAAGMDREAVTTVSLPSPERAINQGQGQAAQRE